MSKLQRTLLIASGSLVLLLGALVWHIHLVTAPKAVKHLANVQLARVDFQAELTSEEAATIRNTVDALPGVQHALVNLDRTNLVYAYDRSEQDQNTVLAVVDELTETPCQRLVVTAQAAASGCPAMSKGGVQDRLAGWIAGMIH